MNSGKTLFAQLMDFLPWTYRESLRDIETCLSAQAAKLYAMGFSDPVRRSTLADANEARDWRIYAELAQRLIVQARRLVPLSKRTAVPSSPFGFPVDGTGCERSNLRKRRFRVPGSQGNLARQGTCVVLNGWCIEACVGAVTGWAIGAGGDPRKPIRDCPADGGARESPRPSDVRPSQRGGSGRQRRSGMIGRDRQAARAVARSPRSTDRSEERGT